MDLFSNFGCSTRPNGQTCVQTASNVFLTALCGTEGSFLSTGYATFPLVSTITSWDGLPTSSAVSLIIMAPMIQINWRSEDLATASQPVSSSMLSATSPSTTPSGSTSAATQPVSSPTVSNASPSSTPSNSISAGTLSGAVIGGVVCLFAIIVAVFFFMKRRKIRSNINDDAMKATVSDRKQGGYEGVSELPSVERSLELPGLRDPSELSGYQSPIELPASLYAPHAMRYRP